MLTKEQKVQEVAASSKRIKSAKSIIFVDFSGVKVEDIDQLKSQLKEAGASFRVAKKRLLKLALEKEGIAFDPLTHKTPVGVVYAPEEMTSVAGSIHKFAKELSKRKIEFQVLGAFDGENKAVLSTEEFTVIAKLPSKEVLLAQIMGGITGPLRAFMSIIDQLSKKEPERQAEAPKKEEPVKEEALVKEAPKEEVKKEEVVELSKEEK